MLFTLIMDGPDVPIAQIGLESNIIKLPLLRPVSGMDERFPPLEDDTVIKKICLHHYYLEQIRCLESFHQTPLEDVIKNPIVHEVLPIYEISPGRINAGGLLDDWERNI
jgi:hypothetical protein